MSKGGGTAIGRGHTILGTIGCLVCSHELPVKRTGGGKLSLCCTWCDAPIYINRGTKAEKIVLERMKPLEAPAAADPGTGIASSSSSASSPAAAEEKPAAEEKKAPPARTFAGPVLGGFGFGT